MLHYVWLVRSLKCYLFIYYFKLWASKSESEIHEVIAKSKEVMSFIMFFLCLCRLLQNNEITGPIPAVVGKLEKLQTLDLSNNKLTGEIPSSLGDLKNLNYLWVWDFCQYKLAKDCSLGHSFRLTQMFAISSCKTGGLTTTALLELYLTLCPKLTASPSCMSSCFSHAWFSNYYNTRRTLFSSFLEWFYTNSIWMFAGTFPSIISVAPCQKFLLERLSELSCF